MHSFINHIFIFVLDFFNYILFNAQDLCICLRKAILEPFSLNGGGGGVKINPPRTKSGLRSKYDTESNNDVIGKVNSDMFIKIINTLTVKC